MRAIALTVLFGVAGCSTPGEPDMDLLQAGSRAVIVVDESAPSEVNGVALYRDGVHDLSHVEPVLAGTTVTIVEDEVPAAGTGDETTREASLPYDRAKLRPVRVVVESGDSKGTAGTIRRDRLRRVEAKNPD